MRIEDLDEFKGLTADMVRAWLRATGWTLTGDQYSEGSVWVSGNGKRIYDSRILTEDGLKWLALVSEVSPQSLLREINQRMQAGWPSEEEIQRHLGDWIARDEIGVLRIGRFSEDEEDGRPLFIEGDDEGYRTQEEVKGWSFWPCDAHGNKVRRGTVSS